MAIASYNNNYHSIYNCLMPSPLFDRTSILLIFLMLLTKTMYKVSDSTYYGNLRGSYGAQIIQYVI